MSSVQAGLTQRLVPETVIQRRSAWQLASESQVSKQTVSWGDGEGDGDAEGATLGLGEGDASTVKLNEQTSSVVVSWTGGSLGEAAGLGLGDGEAVGCFIWNNKTTAVAKRMAVKPISPQINHFLLVIELTPKRYKSWRWCRYKPGSGLPSRRVYRWLT